MTTILAMELIRRAIVLTLMVSGPLLLTGLVIGIVVGLVQAVIQLQEHTLTFIPKAAGVAFVLLLLMPWMLRQLIEYLVGVIRTLPTLAA